MKNDAGMVVAIWVKNSKANGSVAKDFSSASAFPTRADVVNINDVPVMSSPWLIESSVMLRIGEGRTLIFSF